MVASQVRRVRKGERPAVLASLNADPLPAGLRPLDTDLRHGVIDPRPLATDLRHAATDPRPPVTDLRDGVSDPGYGVTDPGRQVRGRARPPLDPVCFLPTALREAMVRRNLTAPGGLTILFQPVGRE